MRTPEIDYHEKKPEGKRDGGGLFPKLDLEDMVRV